MTSESTQAMPAAGGPTMPAPPQPQPGAEATQMGASIACPVCGTTNPGLETYCIECGFLLASSPGEAIAADTTPSPELVEATTGRRFALKPGANMVGRENCDVLVMDPTVSRRHARIDVGPGGVSLTDLGSSNGTLLDGQKLEAHTAVSLAENASLRFGNAAFTIVGITVTAKGFLPGGAPAAEPAEPAAPRGALPAPAAAPDATAPQPAAPPVARLKPTGPNGREITIAPGKITIGRRADNTVVLTGDPYVSGRHAELLCDVTGCYLVDVGSTNGSVVNGERLERGRKQLLLDGDEVRLGQTSFVFETLEGPPAEAAGGPIRMGGDQ